jgi:hypothetical protein
MRIAVIGAGNGGLATAAELTLAGHTVALHARRAETLAPLRADGFAHIGVLGEGRCRPALLTTDLAEAVHGVDGIVVALPTLAHASVARGLHAVGVRDVPVILNPGHTGGLFEVETVFRGLGGPVPPLLSEHGCPRAPPGSPRPIRRSAPACCRRSRRPASPLRSTVWPVTSVGPSSETMKSAGS